MQHKRPPVPVIVILLLVLLVGGYFGLQMLFAEDNGGLKASGTIEAVDVKVSPEMSGKVLDVLASEGGAVQTGVPLLHLDDSLLAAQRTVAAAQVDSAKAAALTAGAALESAKNQYNLAVEAALASEQSNRARDWRFSAPNEFNHPAWYFTQAEQLDSALAEVEAAQTALDEAIGTLQQVTTSLDNGIFLNAEKRLSDARISFLVADDVKIDADYASEGGGLQRAADDAYNAALDEVRAAQNEYNTQLSTQSARDVLDARGKVMVAQQRFDTAQARLALIKSGYYSPAVVTAQYALEQAQAALAQAVTAVSQAEANLALLDTQMEKLAIFAPVDGTVITRNVEPGEFVQPGATVFTLANLEDLTITVYVPEDRYGEISLAQQADVSVDSFPGDVFSAQVTYMSDTAEYTPRNVQTVEGRSATVYAVKLKVDDSEGKLKPGMPADVAFR